MVSSKSILQDSKIICQAKILLRNNGNLLPKLFWPTVRKNREKLLKFEAESQEFSKFLRSLEHSNSERSEQVLVTECFLSAILQERF